MIDIYKNKPEAFFYDDTKKIPLKNEGFGLNVGYETLAWRYDSFANYVLEWLPEFALNYSTLKDFNPANSIKLIKQAAKSVYDTDKYKNRGEFGEIILHAIIRELYDSEPVISKIYYKTSANDPVKGFDAVHMVEGSDGLELWLGEVKFYTEINKAVNDVVDELSDHFSQDFLRKEFMFITGKIAPDWKYINQIKQLISVRRPIDEIFKKIRVPVLLTYESQTVKDYKEVSELFIKKLIIELTNHEKKFYSKLQNINNISISLHLLPLEDKNKLVEILNKKLEGLKA